MLTVNSIKSEDMQSVQMFYFGSDEVAAICSDIKCISNKSKKQKYDSSPVTRSYGSEMINPLYKSCKAETESSLYDNSPVKESLIIQMEHYKAGEEKTINRDGEISEIKEIVGRVNSGIEVIPNIHIFAQDIFEAKYKAEKLFGSSEIFTSQPSFIESLEVNPRNSSLIPADYLFGLMDSLNDFCDKPTLLSDKRHSG